MATGPEGMTPLVVVAPEGDHTIAVEEGALLHEGLAVAGFPVRSACLGTGACGLCRVRIEGVELPPPSRAERLHLTPEALARGERLACRIPAQTGMRIEVLAPAPPSPWRSVSVRGRPLPQQGVALGGHPLMVAIDLGTTNIRIGIIDPRLGCWLAQSNRANPQHAFGADVIHRLGAAGEKGEVLATSVVTAIGEGLALLAERHGLNLDRVVEVGVVGNTAMLLLLCGDRPERLLKPAHWTAPLDCRSPEPLVWRERWGLGSGARIEVMQPVAGFIGSDLLAGLLATQLDQGPAPALLIDFGTNTEVALWDGAELWVTSAAGGPAFEISGYSSGIPAQEGAVHRVEARDGSYRFEVIGAGAPLGVCGSGLVDWVARLLEQGDLNRVGRFRAGSETHLPEAEGIRLTHGDVDNLQQAKSAIATAMAILADEAGVALHEVGRLCIGGEFGLYLDIKSAATIGLLPPIDPDKVEILADTALIGCAAALLDEEGRVKMNELRQRARMVGLALDPRFEPLFVQNLFLGPMSALSHHDTEAS